VLEPLVYKSAEHAPEPATSAAPVTGSAATLPASKPAAKKKSGFFGGFGRFFRRIFGAE
jgi:hypothetical protein